MKNYTTKEAAAILRYNPAYMQKKLKRGEIPAIKVGRKWLITQETIDKLLKTDLPEGK